MKILFNHIGGKAKPFPISVSGSTITVDGDTLDLTAVELGSIIPSDAIDNPLVGECSKALDGSMTVTINYPVNKFTCPIGSTVVKELDILDGEVNPTTVYVAPVEVIV